MKSFRLSLLVTVMVLLVCGCSIRDGIYVVVRDEAVVRVRADLSTWLVARGFQMDAPGPTPPNFFAALRDPTDGKIILSASFHSDKRGSTFFIGKGNSREFSPDEIALMSECAAWLTAHADAFERGLVSKASTAEAIRREFYAKIKKG